MKLTLATGEQLLVPRRAAELLMELPRRSATARTRACWRWRWSLADAFLLGANLYRANLRHANLGDANLGDANLRHANLADGTNLLGANLAGAHLRRANLILANLSGAKLAADLTGVRYDDETVWPEGFKPPPSA